MQIYLRGQKIIRVAGWYFTTLVKASSAERKNVVVINANVPGLYKINRVVTEKDVLSFAFMVIAVLFQESVIQRLIQRLGEVIREVFEQRVHIRDD